MTTTDKSLAAIMAILGRQRGDIEMIKAYNLIILTNLSKLHNLDTDDLLRDVEKFHAIYVLENQKIYDDLISQAFSDNNE